VTNGILLVYDANERRPAGAGDARRRGAPVPRAPGAGPGTRELERADSV